MATKGYCMDMCPSQEREMREKERLLHPLEILAGTEKQRYPRADPSRMVKCFSRSAAGINLACPNQLRPPEVLIQTIKYLLRHVVNDSRFSQVVIYDFIVDRLRSIQQDMVIQSLPPEDCIRILEPIVKFHTLFGYRLCEEKSLNYDPYLNKKHLMEYLKRLLVCYDELEMKLYKNSKKYDMVAAMQALSMKKELNSSTVYEKEILYKRPLIECIYIMSNLGDIHPLERYLKIPPVFKNQILQTCFEISLCHRMKNWIRECQLLKQVHPLALCAGILHLPEVRRCALKVMSHAYNSKALTYPLEKLKETLLYDELSHVIEDCNFCNIKVIDDNKASFTKDSFNDQNRSFIMRRHQFLDDLINLTYIKNTLLCEESL